MRAGRLMSKNPFELSSGRVAATAGPTPAARPGSVAVLVKATALIDALAQRGELTPAQLAEALDEPRSTVYRLLATLQDLEFVEPGHLRGTYRLGLKLFALGATVVQRYDERAASHPVMQRLHEETGETVFLCVRREHQAVCIERIDGVRVALLELRLGGALPLHLGAAPRALLAFEPETAWESYLDAVSLTERTASSPHSRAEVIAELRATRQRGYAVSDQDVTLGVASVGAPIFGHTGAVQASISIGGLRDVVLGTDSPIPGLVLEAAREVSRAMGHRA
jgi:DNA-binding IclR family transcriptional regulator